MPSAPVRSAWLVVAALVAAACAASPYPRPSSAEVAVLRPSDPHARVENLEHGRSLYLSKCSSCHMLHEPASIAPEAWQAKVSDMQREGRVHLSDAEVTDLVRYLRATSLVARQQTNG